MGDKETDPLISQKMPDSLGDQPPLSKWRGLFGTKWIWIPKEFPVVHINYTQLTFFPWIFVDLFIFFSLFYFTKYAFPYLPQKYKLIVEIVEYTLGFYGFLNYFIARVKNPGFLPFNWAATKKKKFTTDEMHSGIAATEEQYNWAKSHEFPPRAWLSSSKGYFILRGDHYCNWVGNFIGLKNHRYFIMGTIGLALYVICSWCLVVYLYFYGKFELHWFKKIILFGGGLYFLGISVMQSLIHILQLSRNSTTVEILRGNYRKYYHGSCIEGWEEVCGPKKYMWLWWLPIPLPEKVDGFSFEPDPNWKPFYYLNQYPYLIRAPASYGVVHLHKEYEKKQKELLEQQSLQKQQQSQQQIDQNYQNQTENNPTNYVNNTLPFSPPEQQQQQESNEHTPLL